MIVNQRVDYERDERLASAFAEASGIAEEGILVDSDYVFSYEGVQLEAANESSYEKFFFHWGSGELDAVLMPESFYRYCKKLEYSFGDLRELWPGNPAELICRILAVYYVMAVLPLYVVFGFGGTAFLNTKVIRKCAVRTSDAGRD